MGYSNMVTEKWADGTYSFALNLAEVEELQRLCSISKDRFGNPIPEPFSRIFNRLTSGDFYQKDLIETIRLGLCGGGTLPARAKELIDTYVSGKPFFPTGPAGYLTNFELAVKICGAVMNGVEQDDRDKNVTVGEPAPIDVPAMRAAMVQCGVPPSEVDKMPLADWVNMNNAVGRKPSSDKDADDFKPIIDELRGLNFAELEKAQGVKLN